MVVHITGNISFFFHIASRAIKNVLTTQVELSLSDLEPTALSK